MSAFQPALIPRIGSAEDLNEIGTGTPAAAAATMGEKAERTSADALAAPVPAPPPAAPVMRSSDKQPASQQMLENKWKQRGSVEHDVPDIKDAMQFALFDALLLGMFARDMPEANHVRTDRSAACTWSLRKSKRQFACKLTIGGETGKSKHTFAFDPVRQQWSRQVHADELDMPRTSHMLHTLIADELRTHGWRDGSLPCALPFPAWSRVTWVSKVGMPAQDGTCLSQLCAPAALTGNCPCLQSTLPQIDTVVDRASMHGHTAALRPVARCQLLQLGNGKPPLALASLALSPPMLGATIVWMTAIRDVRSHKLDVLVSLSLYALVQHLQAADDE